MLKPAPIALRVLLWCLHHQIFPTCGPHLKAGFTVPDGAEDVVAILDGGGYRRLGKRIMRVDMVERVAALVRAAARDGIFEISDDMLSLAGVGRSDMALMLRDLGCRQVGERPSEDPEKPAIAKFERVQKKRVPRPKQKQTARNKDKDKDRHKHRAKGSSSQGHRQTVSPQRRGTKELDPNSPFAVLAALKK